MVLALLWRRPNLFAWVVAADATAELVAYGLRAAIDRPRPTARYPQPEALVHVPSGPGLPSGHATTSFACATVLAVAAPRLALPLLALAAAIAWSRVYVGVHYPLDVLAGAALGALIGLVVTGADRARRSAPPSRGDRGGSPSSSPSSG